MSALIVRKNNFYIKTNRDKLKSKAYYESIFSEATAAESAAAILPVIRSEFFNDR